MQLFANILREAPRTKCRFLWSAGHVENTPFFSGDVGVEIQAEAAARTIIVRRFAPPPINPGAERMPSANLIAVSAPAPCLGKYISNKKGSFVSAGAGPIDL